VFVSDSGNDRVDVFTSTGQLVRELGSSPGTGPPIPDPFDVAVDGGGNVYLVAAEGLIKFAPNGHRLWVRGGPSSAQPDLVGRIHLAAFDRHGRALLVSDANGNVLFVNPDGREVESFSAAKGSDLTCEATIDAAGDIFVTDCGSGAGTVFNRAHHLVARWSAHDVALFVSPRFTSPTTGFALTAELDPALVEVRVSLRQE
jgi:DNA-binding beta-propeller fold protein YncE